MPDLLNELNAALSGVVESAQRSLVQIHNGRHGAGAGIVCHPEGLIVTNAHVVDHPGLRVVLADERVLPARLLAHDAQRDLAVLTVDTAGLPAIELGDSRRLQPGQWVFALGHPWGVTGAATGGVVIGVGAEWPEMPRSGQEWVVVNLHLRPGHSGGSLVDAQGRLVGINTLMTGPDVGVAVPVHVVKAFLRQTLKINA